MRPVLLEADIYVISVEWVQKPVAETALVGYMYTTRTTRGQPSRSQQL